MGFISGLLGTAGGANGSGSAGPNGATIANPATQQMGTDALNQQQALINAYQPGGTAALASQQQLLQQLQQQSVGNGPNPAQAQLAAATSANTANQAALMAGQRGSSQNAGLIARQAAQQGAQNQQQSALGAAQLNAQQQIAARQQLQQQQSQLVNQQQQGTQQYVGNTLGAIQGQNQANVGMQSNINTANAGLASQTMGAQQNMLGNLTGGIGAGLQTFTTPGGAANAFLGGLAEGGEVHMPNSLDMFAEGGQAPITKMAQGGMPSGPQSRLGQHLAGMSPQPKAMPQMAMMAQGGKVPALVSPGEKYLTPQAVQQVKQGANPMEVGKTVPGKPKVGGAKNDYANDTVKATLDEGGIVLPRSVTQSKHPHWAAHKFVSAVMAKQGKSIPKKVK